MRGVLRTDGALGIRAALEVPLERLPSRSEVFYFNTSINGRFSNASARTVLGWKPKHGLKVRRTVVAGIWAALFAKCQQCSCGQGYTTNPIARI